MMHGDGLMAGIFTFLLIGALHGAVIKGEYYFSKKIWPLFLLGGLGCLALSLFLPDAIWRCLAAVTGFSLLWSIRELFQQEERVRKGWFPRNPKRIYKK